MEIWIVSAVAILGLVAYFAFFLWLGAQRRHRQLQRKDERRHAEQLEWRASGRLPVRYVTTYAVGEVVDEDMARMIELGYYVAEDGILPSGARHVVYRLQGASAL